MSKAAVSLVVFGGYLFVVGVWLLLDPNSLLGMFGFDRAEEIWVRVLGMILILLSAYYVLAARNELTSFIQWTVDTRGSVILFFSAFVALGMAPAGLLIFGVIDLLAAGWTQLALRRDAAR